MVKEKHRKPKRSHGVLKDYPRRQYDPLAQAQLTGTVDFYTMYKNKQQRDKSNG